ncbi:MAG: glucose-6-phosphate isomerase [Thermodesulfobacteriota bacterium]|nr:glucose-6-phosphate isomerase [Thermodesulfobacteriota bacterium]
MKNFDLLPACERLHKLAKTSYELNGAEALGRDRLLSFICRGAGFDILYGTQQVDESVVDALQELADESSVADQFKMMKQGEIMNSIHGFAGENRKVLHTATRDVFDESPCNMDASIQAKNELAKLKFFLKDLENGKITNSNGEVFTHMIHVGIGGSDLGPRAIYLALAAFRRPERRVYFISNVDPDDAAAVLQDLDLRKTLVNVVSKSGTTLETLTNEELVRAAYVKAGLDPGRHFLAVTGQGSPMDNPEKYLRSFYMFDYIGGRYSSTSMVGGVMIGFALGYDGFMELLQGANDMDKLAEEKNIRNNPPLILALLGIWNHNFLGYETVAVLPYSQALIRFVAHLQQCDMESNGKSCNRQGGTMEYHTGPIVWGEPGTNGQHAFYQLIHQGTTTVPVEFIGFRKSQYDDDILIKGTTSQEKLNANLLAQSLALATGQESDNPNQRFPGNRPSTVIMADRLTPYRMGALLAMYEAKIVFQGFIWNINSFDQEGVQLGKVLANRILDHYSGRRQDEKYSGDSEDSVAWSLLEAAGML